MLNIYHISLLNKFKTNKKMATTRLLTTIGFKNLNEEQFKLYEQIWFAFKEFLKDDALKLLREWEQKYPELPSHSLFRHKEIKSKNYYPYL
jgi:hypothetical protein